MKLYRKDYEPYINLISIPDSATVVIDDGEDEPTTLGNYHRELSSSITKTTVQSANIGSVTEVSPTKDADRYSNSCPALAKLPSALQSTFNDDASANTILDLSKRVLRLEQEQVRYTQLVASLYKKLDDNRKRPGQNNKAPSQFTHVPYPKYALLYTHTQPPVNIPVHNLFEQRKMQLHPLDNLM